MGDERVGHIADPTVLLSVAVASSAAFPPTMNTLYVEPAQFASGSGQDLATDDFRRAIPLVDGGVYDNLGLKPAWNHANVLVSDGGVQWAATSQDFFFPVRAVPSRLYRVLQVMNNAERSIRKQQVLESYEEVPNANSHRGGAYWGIGSDIDHYGLAITLPCPYAKTMLLEQIPTGLNRLKALTQERLINWGYAICDAALRKHVDTSLSPPAGFPYPASAV
jgi:NTE family protein